MKGWWSSREDWHIGWTLRGEEEEGTYRGEEEAHSVPTSSSFALHLVLLFRLSEFLWNFSSSFSTTSSCLASWSQQLPSGVASSWNPAAVTYRWKTPATKTTRSVLARRRVGQRVSELEGVPKGKTKIPDRGQWSSGRSPIPRRENPPQSHPNPSWHTTSLLPTSPNPKVESLTRN